MVSLLALYFWLKNSGWRLSWDKYVLGLGSILYIYILLNNEIILRYLGFVIKKVDLTKPFPTSTIFKASFSVCCKIVLQFSNKSHNMKALIMVKVM